MKAVMTTENLRDALKKAKPVRINKQLAILSSALLEFDDGKVTLTTSDLERGIRVGFEGEAEEPFSMVVPLKTTEKFLQGANGKVRLEVGKSPKDIIMGRDGIGEFHLAGFSQPSDFPKMPQADNLVWSELDAKWFCRMLKIMVTACFLEENRPVLTGVSWKDGVMASADGFRLVVLKDSRLNFELGAQEVIVPAITANLVRRLFGKEERLEVAFEVGASDASTLANPKESVRRVYFRAGGTWMVSEVIQGNYPKYEMLIPKAYECKVSFSAPVMEQRLGMIDEIYHGIVKFDFHKIERSKEYECSLVAGDMEDVRYSLALPVKIERGEDGRIAFNMRYIVDALQFFSMATLEMTTPSSPGKFTGDIEGLTIVVMPMFVQW